MNPPPSAESPANLEEALGCIRGDEERAAERFALRQHVLLGGHLGTLLGEEALTRCGRRVQFVVRIHGSRHPVVAATDSLGPETCAMGMKALLGECSQVEGLTEYIAETNTKFLLSELVLTDGIVQHTVMRPVVTADLTVKDVVVALQTLTGLPPQLLEEMRTRFGLDTSETTIHRIVEAENLADPSVEQPEPPRAESSEQGNLDLPPAPGAEPAMGERPPQNPEQEMIRKFDEKAFNHLLAKLGSTLRVSPKETPDRQEGRSFSWMEEALSFHVNAVRQTSPHNGARTHVLVFAHVFMGRVASRYAAARRWARRRMGNNSVGLFESDSELLTGRLTLQTSSLLRPEDMEGMETMLQDIRHEARQFVRLFKTYHSLMPADWVFDMEKAGANGGKKEMAEVSAILGEPGRVAREILETGAACQLEFGVRLANHAEDWKTQLALLERWKKEAAESPGQPSEQDYLMARCRALYRLGRWQEGLDVASSIQPLPADPVDRAWVQCALAIGNRGLKQWDEMLDALRGADADRAPRIHILRAVALCRLGRLRESVVSSAAYFGAVGPDPYADRELEHLHEAYYERQRRDFSEEGPVHRGVSSEPKP